MYVQTPRVKHGQHFLNRTLQMVKSFWFQFSAFAHIHPTALCLCSDQWTLRPCTNGQVVISGLSERFLDQ